MAVAGGGGSLPRSRPYGRVAGRGCKNKSGAKSVSFQVFRVQVTRSSGPAVGRSPRPGTSLGPGTSIQGTGPPWPAITRDTSPAPNLLLDGASLGRKPRPLWSPRLRVPCGSCLGHCSGQSLAGFTPSNVLCAQNPRRGRPRAPRMCQPVPVGFQRRLMARGCRHDYF